MSKGETLVGQRYGSQVVIRAVGKGKVEIRCDCGTVQETRIQYLLSGESRSCGCGRYGNRRSAAVRIGDVFDHLTVVQELGSNGSRREVLCQCSCGTRKVLSEDVLRSGATKSCGCYRRALMASKRTHGEAGSRRTTLYRTWSEMRRRCADPIRHPQYVGRPVHPEWHAFKAFRDYVVAELGERPEGHSLDRIDNDRGYEPGNIRWATHKQQVRNRKSNVRITIDGVTRCLTEWAEISGIPSARIHQRIKHGWDPVDAVLKPLRT